MDFYCFFFHLIFSGVCPPSSAVNEYTIEGISLCLCAFDSKLKTSSKALISCDHYELRRVCFQTGTKCLPEASLNSVHSNVVLNPSWDGGLIISVNILL